MSNFRKSWNNFTQVPNHIINDKNVSPEAKGVYLYLSSKPDGWEFSLNGILSQNKMGREKLIRIISELEKFCYLKKYKRRLNGKQLPNEYELFDVPYSSTESEKPTRENRLGKTDSGNRTTSNTNISKKEKSNTISTYEERVSFNSFKENFIKNNMSKLFTTDGIGWLAETEFTINSDGLIFNTVSQKILNKEDAFKIWKYLFEQSNKDK
jgi:hypothetical protein